MSKYDYCIVGAGLFGSTFAYEATKKGYKCLVVEKRHHIGGNIYTEKKHNIDVHTYGAHIFHTNKKHIWDYVNNLTPFSNFINAPLANYEENLYSLPFNMHTFKELFGVIKPEEAKRKINEETLPYQDLNPSNLEEKALTLVGPTIYHTLIKGYSEKQWGKSAKDIPSFVITRLPLRFTYNTNYFTDYYQGIPAKGYTDLIEKMLKDVTVKLNTDFLKHKSHYEVLADKVVYTGNLDELFDCEEGHLEYRSLTFKHETKETDNHQGNAVINFTSEKIPYTRIIEHKHFNPDNHSPKTVLSYEYPVSYDKSVNDPYYPVNDETNNALYKHYLKRLKAEKKTYIAGGRLGMYKYLNMDQIIEEALKLVKDELHS